MKFSGEIFRWNFLKGLLFAVVIMGCSTAFGAEGQGKACNAHEQDTLYTIGYAHLDTQWRWTFQDSIYRYVADTMRDNFALFEKFPGYRFNFTGSKRYIMMKEYYPEDFEILKKYVDEGKWLVSGSSVDENDANVPSTESLVRNVLYGNLYFKNEFGKVSEDYMLPDCFGFPAFMPSVLAHAGIKGFSTQKLTWRSAVGIPFNVGVWEGPDGRSIMAALNPGAYVSRLSGDLSNDEGWLKRVQDMGALTGFHADFKYFGTGDQGGAPDEESAKWMQTSLDSDGPLCVDAAQSDDIFQDATEEEVAKMKRFKGDMLLIEHSAGSLTSQAYVKRWNRKTELLADDAERTALIADWLGAISYPTERLREVWYLILGTQMHDILPGTSIPKAYEFSWNDSVMALNGAAAVIESSVGATALQLDTKVDGQPLVVYNPLSIEREDVVQAKVTFAGGAPNAVKVFDAVAEVPAQVISRDGDVVEIAFLAKVPSVGYKVFDVRKSDAATANSALSVSANAMENERFKVQIDENGDVSSIYDKKAKREVLSAPIGLEFMHDSPKEYPAWNIDWEDWQNPARAVVGGPAKTRIVESGPVRVAIEVTRELEGSTFIQTIRLSAGDAGNRIEFDTDLDWRTQATTLKASFPLSVSNENASYNMELGVIDRNTNHPKKFEVPSHQWFDLTDADGSYGATIIDDSKYASDKPSDSIVRLTLVRTPDCRSYCDQATQDLGRHEVLYAIAPHEGDWRKGNSHWQAMRLNQPMTAFTTGKHDGKLGRSFSFLSVSSPDVAVRAAKMAEESDNIIVRLQELNEKTVKGMTISFASPVVSAMEVDGQEREIGPAVIKDGKLVVDMDPFYMKAFAVELAPSEVTVAKPVSEPLKLDYDVAAISMHKEMMETGVDGQGNAYPGDIIPKEISVDGINFKLGEAGAAKLNALSCKGQELKLPEGNFEKLYILAASVNGETGGVFKAGDKATDISFQEWTGMVGQWDNRIWKDDRNIFGLRPAFTKRDEIAWTTSQHHNKYGRKIAYQYSYLFKYAIDIPAGAKSVKLPDNDKIRILAATAVSGAVDSVAPAQLMYDDFVRPEDAPNFTPSEGSYSDTTSVKILYPWYSRYDEIRYTTDGSDVTKDSPVYTSPLLLAENTIIKARAYSADGRVGLLNEATYEINDVTPPSIEKVTAFELASTIMVKFTEPVDKASAEVVANYAVSPDVKVKSAALGADGETVFLDLSVIPSSKQEYTLIAMHVKDVSKAANAIRKVSVTSFSAAGPGLDVKIRTKDLGYSLGVPGISRDFTINGDPKAVKGPFGLAVRMDGDKDSFILNNRAEFNPVEAITLSAWVRARDWNGNRRIMQKGADDNQYRLLAENGTLLFDIAGVGALRGDLPTAGEWHHVAATYDGNSMKMYVDGALIGEKLASGPIPITDNPLVIGTKNTNSDPVDYFVGDMDKIMVWGHALSQEHIAVLAAK